MFKKKKNRNLGQKIAIIGAGAAGLTAADRLIELGYTNVTVFEKEKEVGGKVMTHYVDGKPYELGAALLFKKCTSVLKLAKKYKVPYVNCMRGDEELVMSKTGNLLNYSDYVVKKYSFSEIVASYIKFQLIMKKYKKYLKPGFTSYNLDLFVDFDTFIVKNKIEPLGEALRLFLLICGYGYYKNIPTVYLLTHFAELFDLFRRVLLDQHLPFFVSGIYKFTNGYQSLWKTVASHHNVLCGLAIKKIIRTNEGIKLTFTNSDEQFFDKAIVTIPGDLLSQVVDSDLGEADLFPLVKTHKYQAVTFKAKGLTMDGILMFENQLTDMNKGHSAGFYKSYKGSDVYIAYQFHTLNENKKDLEKFLAEDVKRLGGEIVEICAVHDWDYFPHVDSEALKDGFYQKFEELQGKRGLYYAGSLFGFESVETTSRYSKYLIQRYF